MPMTITLRALGLDWRPMRFDIYVDDITVDSTVNDLITNEQFLQKLNETLSDQLGGIALSNTTGSAFAEHFVLSLGGRGLTGKRRLKDTHYADYGVFELVRKQTSSSPPSVGPMSIALIAYRENRSPLHLSVYLTDIGLDSTVDDLVINEKFLQVLNKEYGDELGGVVLSNVPGSTFVEHITLRFKNSTFQGEKKGFVGDQTLGNVGYRNGEYFGLFRKKQSTSD